MFTPVWLIVMSFSSENQQIEVWARSQHGRYSEPTFGIRFLAGALGVKATSQSGTKTGISLRQVLVWVRYIKVYLIHFFMKSMSNFLSIYSYIYKVVLERRKMFSFISIWGLLAARRSKDDLESSCVLPSDFETWYMWISGVTIKMKFKMRCQQIQHGGPSHDFQQNLQKEAVKILTWLLVNFTGKVPLGASIVKPLIILSVAGGRSSANSRVGWERVTIGLN